MAVTTDQYNQILARLTAIEELLNDVLVAMGKFVTLGQVNQLHTLIQTDLQDVHTTLEALENRIQDIEEDPGD